MTVRVITESGTPISGVGVDLNGGFDGLAADTDADVEPQEWEDAAWDDSAEPQIVRTKSIELTPMTIDDAVLRMQLLDHPFFLFCNRDSGHASVLYRRDDGDIGLIEGIGSDHL